MIRKLCKWGGAILIALTVLASSCSTVFAEEGDTYEDVLVTLAGKPVLTIISTCVKYDFWDEDKNEWEHQAKISDDLPAGMSISFQMSGDGEEDSWGVCTMTLNNCTVDAGGRISEEQVIKGEYIKCNGCDLNLVLHGQNVLKGGTDSVLTGIDMEEAYGSYETGKLGISGDGSLTIDLSGAEERYGIMGQNQVNVNGCTLNITGGQTKSKYPFYGITMHVGTNKREELTNPHIQIKDAKVNISNSTNTASNLGIDAQDADLAILGNSNVQIDLTGGDSCGLAAGWIDPWTDTAYAGKMTIDASSLITLRLAGKDTDRNALPSMYFFRDEIKSPFIYTGEPGTAARKTGKAAFQKHSETLDRYESYSPFLAFAPSEQTFNVPVLPGKMANPMTVKAKTVTAKSKANTTITAGKAFVVRNKKGAVTYKKVSGDKKVTVAKTGKITVKKGLKKGKTYSVKVKVTDAGSEQYKSVSKTVTLKINVK